MKLSILGIENYLNQQTPSESLFDDWEIPEDIDEDVLIRNILTNTAEFETIYPEPSFLKDEITNWSKMWYRTFQKWVEALAIEYAPLENYSMIEDYTTNGNSQNSNVNAMSSTNDTTVNVDTDNTNSMWAYNSGTNDTNTDKSVGNNDTSENTISTASTTNAGNEIHAETQHHTRSGNIGVTTSQQMLQSELDIARFNLIQQITDIFAREFCLMIY